MDSGVLVVISGFSGAGKGTLVKRLLEKYENYVLSISATTRSPREGEQDGREYFFVTRERFEEMISGGELIEYTSYVGNYYGTPRDYVDRMRAAGRDIIFEIETEGAGNIRRIYPDAVLIFVTLPSAEVLAGRLRSRGTEDEETIRSRLAQAYTECGRVDDYDYVVVNDDLEEAVETIHSIVRISHMTPQHSRQLIETMEQGLAPYSQKHS